MRVPPRRVAGATGLVVLAAAAVIVWRGGGSSPRPAATTGAGSTANRFTPSNPAAGRAASARPRASTPDAPMVRSRILDHEPPALPPPPLSADSVPVVVPHAAPFTQDEFVERRENGIVLVDDKIDLARSELDAARLEADVERRRRAEHRLQRLVQLRELRVAELELARQGELHPEGYGQGDPADKHGHEE